MSASYDLTPDPSREVTPYAEALPLVGQDLARYQEESRGPDLRSVWSFARRNWWILAAFTLIGALVAFLYNQTATPVYQANTTIQLEGQTTAMPAGFQMFPTTSYVATDILVLQSRSLAERVADTLAVQVRVTAPAGVPREQVFSHVAVTREARPGMYVLRRREPHAFELARSEGDPIRAVRPGEPFTVPGATLVLSPTAAEHEEIEFTVRDFQSTVGRMMGNMHVVVPGRDPRAEALQITYTDSDSHLVAAVPNALAEAFIDFRRQKQKQAAISTVEFLRAQLDTLNLQLREAELALRKYRESSQVIDLVTESSTRITQYSLLKSQRDAIIMERNAILNVQSQMRSDVPRDPLSPSPYRGLVAFPSLAGALSTPIGQLASLETSRNLLLQRRTPDDPDVQVLTEQIRRVEEDLSVQTDAYLRSLESNLAAIDPVIAGEGAAMAEIPRKEFELAELMRLPTLLGTTALTLQTSLKEAEITKAIDDPTARVIDRAIAPRSPIRPRKLWNLILGVILGFAGGVGIAYSRELLDTRIHTRDDLRELTGVPVLGLIPRMADMPSALPFPSRRLLKPNGRQATLSDGKQLAPPRLIAESDRGSAVSEAFRSLRTNITFSATPERASKVFVLTSATPQDGKTTTAANLAVTFAQQGLRVILVDADMRRGVLHKLFRVPRTPGLSNILVENVEFEQAIHRVQLDQSELDVLPTGTVPPNPAELLSAPRMRWLVQRLEEQYDAILFDTPPLTLVTDAAILASRAHSVLFVARANKTEQGAIHFAMEQLRNVGAPIRGTILNDVDVRRDGYGGKYDYTPYSTAYEPHVEA